MGNIEKQVMHKHQSELDDIAISLMKGTFKVIEIEQSLGCSEPETIIRLYSNGHEIEVSFGRKWGF